MTPLRVRYQTIEFGHTDIHLRTLRDNQQYADVDGIALRLGISSATWPLFGIVWASGTVLAHLMAEHEIDGLRILEVGCGIALASLVLNQRHANITATDYHPEAGNFLRENVTLNHGSAIPFVRTGWEDEATELGVFDLIIGSDILYERDHAGQIAAMMLRHARPDAELLITDPGRGNSGPFTRAMAAQGYTVTEQRSRFDEKDVAPFRGRLLSYQRDTSIPVLKEPVH